MFGRGKGKGKHREDAPLLINREQNTLGSDDGGSDGLLFNGRTALATGGAGNDPAYFQRDTAADSLGRNGSVSRLDGASQLRTLTPSSFDALDEALTASERDGARSSLTRGGGGGGGYGMAAEEGRSYTPVRRVDRSDSGVSVTSADGSAVAVQVSADEKQNLRALIEQIETAVEELKVRVGLEAPEHVPIKNPKLKPIVTNNLLLSSFLWQVLNIVVLTLIESHTASSKDVERVITDVSLGVMMFFQVLHVMFILITSVKLTKQVMHRTVSGWFLMQSYLSTVILFGGIYTLIYSFDTTTFAGVKSSSSSSSTTESIVILFLRLIYFSVSTMTTVGYGDVTPAVWWTFFLVTFQMLLSVVYTTVIFAKGLAHFGRPRPGGRVLTRDPRPRRRR